MTSRFLRTPHDTPLALDRSSVRTVDADGRLHCAVTNVSKSGVNPYFGGEIHGAQAFGLDPMKKYMVLRPAEELAKAASTFCRLPLLSTHVMASAADHQPDVVVGATGSDAQFVAPYLRCSLVIWAQSAIDGVLDNSKRQLSSAYRYRFVPQSGTHDGIRYDGFMTDIRGSHVSLVDIGRAGADVVVGDALPRALRKPRWRNLMATDTTETDDDKIVSTLMQFLGDRLQPEELDAVKAILAGQPAPPTEAAMDAARRVSQAQRTKDHKSYLERFPNAERLR